jgi:acetyl-CoA carboxylase biotin carboxylase subunit
MALRRVLVANRGEIAVRILRACVDEQIETVLAVSDADRQSLGAKLADRVICIGPASATQSYLDIDRLVAAAELTGCDGLHPGYGFVSERPELPAACAEAGVAFVGPSEAAMRRGGDKATSRQLAKELGIAIGEGSGIITTAEGAAHAAEAVGYPVLIKAAGGGGGRGMRLVETADALPAAWAAASGEAEQAFGDGRVFIERYVRRARHVEVQVLADTHGHVIHLGHRDCTMQRRYQKLIEEAPASAVPEPLAAQILQAATTMIGALDYHGAATVEFLVDVERHTYAFLEINARLQVEHPVSELVTGVDVVREQLRIAGGETLSVTQDDVRVHGHAIEARINCESPAHDFQPSPGRLEEWVAPIGTHVRTDTACYPGWTIAPYYDSLLAKVIAYGDNREQALARLTHALQQLRVTGVPTTAGFIRDVLHHPDVIAGDVHTRWLEEEFLPKWTPEEEAA